MSTAGLIRLAGLAGVCAFFAPAGCAIEDDTLLDPELVRCTPTLETGGLEVCNGVDDDCDGVADDGDRGGPIRRACMTACGAGVEECVGGAWAYCTTAPFDEACNGVDDNCDGVVDESCGCRHGETRACGSMIGACRPGVEQCAFGAWTGECHNFVGPSNELCGNGLDDDCNGDTDETCACAPGSTQACGIEAGECRRGEQTCSPTGSWGGACAGAVEPILESCNGLDDDCDGAIDWNDALASGWRADAFEAGEGNGVCERAVTIPNAIEDGGWTKIPTADELDPDTYPSVYPIGDEDWYAFRAETISHGLCLPGTSQCSLVLRVALEIFGASDPRDYDFCIAVVSACGDVSADTRFCAEADDWVESSQSYLLALKWGGVCGSDDSRDVVAVVKSKSGAKSCEHYQLSARLVFDPNEACPE